MGKYKGLEYFVEDFRKVQTASLVDSTCFPLIEKVTPGGFHYEVMIDHIPNEWEPKVARLEHFVGGQLLTVDINFNMLDQEPTNNLLSRSEYDHGVLDKILVSFNGFLGTVPAQSMDDPLPVALVYAMNQRQNFDLGIMVVPALRRVFYSPRGSDASDLIGNSANFNDEGIAGMGISSELGMELEFWLKLNDDSIKMIVQSRDEWVARQFPLFCDYSNLKGRVSFRQLTRLVDDMAIVSWGKGYNWRHE